MSTFAITVRLPRFLDAGGGLTLTDPVRNLGELIAAVDRRLPGFAAQVDDAIFNFAVNDEIILHNVRATAVADGDIVEVVPTISGGAACAIACSVRL